MPDSVKISVLVSTYASEEFMAECLDDLVGQSAADRLEIVVVDANSPQNEGAIVARYKERFPRITYIRTPERIGIYAAWNVAIRAARGEYLLSFSTNDRLAPDACEVLSRYLDEHPEVDLVYGDTHLTDQPHQTMNNFSPMPRSNGSAWQWPEFSYFELLATCMVGPHPMWRKRIHGQVGWFDESFRSLGDQDFWLRLGRTHVLRHIPRFTGLYWHDSNALSSSMTARSEEERIRKTYLREYLAKQHFGPCDGQRMAILECLEDGRPGEAVAHFQVNLKPCLLAELAKLAEVVGALAQQGKYERAQALLRAGAARLPDFPEIARMQSLLAEMAAKPRA